jgi:hypothetical protein
MKISLADPRLERLSTEVARAQGLVSQGEYPEAKRVFMDALQATRDLGVTSGDVFWGLAVVSDFVLEFRDAVRFCRLALETDPLSPSYRRSWAVIGRRIREALLTGSRGESLIPELHKLAVEAGVADDQAHLRLAQHLLKQGKLDHAQSFLEAFTTLSPSCKEAWMLLADVGRRAGNVDLTERCSLAIGADVTDSDRWPLQPAAEA